MEEPRDCEGDPLIDTLVELFRECLRVTDGQTDVARFLAECGSFLEEDEVVMSVLQQRVMAAYMAYHTIREVSDAVAPPNDKEETERGSP